MKKQKKPILLILSAAALFGYVGYSQMPKGSPNQATPPPETKPEDKKQDVASNVSELVKTDKPQTETHRPARTKGNTHMQMQSSLVKTDASEYKPKPNLSATSSQWYEPAASNK